MIEIELAVLHDLDPEIIQGLDRGVAGQEILRTRTEGEDLQALEPEADARDGHELADHRGDFVRDPHGIGWDVRTQAAQAQVIRAEQSA
jgi:hypothetical protein